MHPVEPEGKPASLQTSGWETGPHQNAWTFGIENIYPLVRKELAGGIHILYVFPVQRAAKELPRVPQASNRIQ